MLEHSYAVPTEKIDKLHEIMARKRAAESPAANAKGNALEVITIVYWCKQNKASSVQNELATAF